MWERVEMRGSGVGQWLSMIALRREDGLKKACDHKGKATQGEGVGARGDEGLGRGRASLRTRERIAGYCVKAIRLNLIGARKCEVGCAKGWW